jgi:hypothetical protein
MRVGVSVRISSVAGETFPSEDYLEHILYRQQKHPLHVKYTFSLLSDTIFEIIKGRERNYHTNRNVFKRKVNERKYSNNFL